MVKLVGKSKLAEIVWKLSWPNLRYCCCIYLERSRISTKALVISADLQAEMNPGLLEYKVRALTTHLQHLVEVNCELQFPISLFPRETIRDAR